jgi:hypothetical protein
MKDLQGERGRRTLKEGPKRGRGGILDIWRNAPREVPLRDGGEAPGHPEGGTQQ